MRPIPTATLSLSVIIAFGLTVPHPAATESYTLTTLASFNGANGDAPAGDLVRDAQGNLLGTTSFGGAFGKGTIFELSPVPEPTSLMLLGAGLVGVVALALRTAWRDGGGRIK